MPLTPGSELAITLFPSEMPWRAQRLRKTWGLDWQQRLTVAGSMSGTGTWLDGQHEHRERDVPGSRQVAGCNSSSGSRYTFNMVIVMAASS